MYLDIARTVKKSCFIFFYSGRTGKNRKVLEEETDKNKESGASFQQPLQSLLVPITLFLHL
jgi:hypothetical protein